MTYYPGRNANEVRAFMQECALKTARTAAERHRGLVDRATTLPMKMSYGPDQEQAMVTEILKAGEALDRAIRSCLMHGLEREVLAEELSEWLSPTYVQDLLDNPF